MIKDYIKKIVSVENRARIRMLVLDIKRLFITNPIQTEYPYFRVKEDKANVFFGYYDITPFSKDENNILYLSVKDGNKIAEVKLYDLNSKKHKILTQTRAWNWQQGCRLRWHPKKEDTIIFNDANENYYFSRWRNIQTMEEQVIPYPLYDIDKNAQYGITTDFSRLGRLRPGYGYTLFNYDFKDIKIEDACVSVVNLNSKQVVDEISYNCVIKMLNIPETDLCNCYVNHLSFNPSGDKFLFFFIQIKNNYHQANMLIYDMKTKKISISEKDMKVSHYMWENNDTIIATAYNTDYQCNYYRYKVGETTPMPVLSDKLTRDGHPSLFSDGRWLSDTYPGKDCFQKLLMIDEKNRKVETLMKIYSTPHFGGEKRTDLHPRLSKSNSTICIDANVSGHRNVILLKMKIQS